MSLFKKKNYDLIFLGLAKNVDKTLLSFFKSCEYLSFDGLKICTIIGENSSKDKTREILKNFKTSKFDLIYLKTDFLNVYKNRILRLTYGREFLKNYILDKNIISKFVSVVDLDSVISNGIDKSSFLNTIKILNNNQDSLFGVSAKSNPFYYDMLPLIIKDYFEFDIYKIQTTFNLLNFYNDRKKFIYDFQKKITKMRDVMTISSHNGLTTYIYSDFITGSYIKNFSNDIKSEHINFNLSINKKNNKYILMTNKIKLITPSEHMPLNLFEFLKRTLIKNLSFN